MSTSMDNEVYKFLYHDWPNAVLAKQFGFLDDKEGVKSEGTNSL